jgi:DNA-directed RNA polymerase subunit omega
VARITIEDCNEQVGNRFNLVVMASIRAKQLMRGARALVSSDENREIVVSLREIAAGYVEADFPEEEPEAPAATEEEAPAAPAE